MRILVVTTSFPASISKSLAVAGKFVLYECMAYEKNGASVEVVTPDVSVGPREDTAGQNIKVHRFRYFFPRHWQILRRPDGSALYARKDILTICQFPFLFFGFVLSILKHARRADIIHCNWSFTALAALPAKYVYNVPVVLTTRGSDLRLIPRFLNRFIFSSMDAVVDCFGPDYRKLFDSIPAPYVEMPVITPEPDLSPSTFERDPADDGLLVVLIGRFDDVKLRLYGMPFFDLIDATAKFSKDRKIQAIFVGDGPLKDQMESRCRELDCADVVKFVGFQENVYPFLVAADLVAGGLGLNAVSQEAAILGKVQLMPKIEHWYESIWRDKENALLYEPGDPQSFADALQFAIEEPERMEAMRENVHKTATQYVATTMDGGRRYLELFDSIIDRKRALSAKRSDRT